MRKRCAIVVAVSSVLFLVFPFSQRAQNSPAKADNSQHAKRSFAINLLRAINTAEMAYRDKHGSFANWHDLRNSEEFTANGLKWAARQEPQLSLVQLSDGSQVAPGWSLRFNLIADSRGYDVLLEDTTENSRGYAVFTDERGLIRESSALQ